jgi:replicative DNA helicase
LYNWQKFLDDYKDRGYEWIIPGLLEKQERVIVVAAEGVGKTMLARQVAICSAAGIHPFTFQPMEPITTLMIDLENPERIIQRTSNNIMREALKMGKTKQLDAHLYIQPAGLDLTSSKDRALVERLCQEIKPQLIVLGPLYKAYVDNGNKTSEALAVEVAKFLDRIRDVYGCALWLEHHAPLGSTSSSRELRPFGSSVWSRWPEFGISLTPDPMALDGYVYQVNHFRGARDNRAWPIRMKRAVRFPFETLEFMKMN